MNAKIIAFVLIIVSALLMGTLLTSCCQVRPKASAGGGQNVENKTNSTTNNMTTTKKTIQLTRADFLKKVADFEKNSEEWVYLGDKPAIIDFYADWCGPCKMIAPVLEELAKEYEGKLYIYKVNTEVEQQLAAEFGIRSIPSLLFVPMEGAPQMAQGALPKDALKQAIDEVLLKK
ncbi:MAG: thioredoxin [Bacteroidota bacterium]|jgi:thioredoxin|nr:thioredoxin [Bacteroidota bacterium]